MNFMFLLAHADRNVYLSRKNLYRTYHKVVKVCFSLLFCYRPFLKIRNEIWWIAAISRDSKLVTPIRNMKFSDFYRISL